MNDFHGFRRVFYSTDKPIFASHLNLLYLADLGESEIQKFINGRQLTYDYPYNFTSKKNQFLLLPNHYLKIPSMKTKRFYPIEKRKVNYNVNIVANEILKNYNAQIRYLNNIKPLILSLSAGKDSRVSYYSTGELKNKIIYFTESRDWDIDGAKEIAVEDQLNWIGIDTKDFKLEQNPTFQKFCQLAEANIFPRWLAKKRNCSFILTQLFDKDKFIHIHSNGGETGRGRTGITYAEMPISFCFEKYLDLYCRLALLFQQVDKKEEEIAKLKQNKELRKIIKLHVDSINNSNIAKLGYNPWDFIYLEGRSAGFLSGIQLNNDRCFESLSLTNTRNILDTMWSLPDEAINRSNILYNYILLNSKNIEIENGYPLIKRPTLDSEFLIFKCLYKRGSMHTILKVSKITPITSAHIIYRTIASYKIGNFTSQEIPRLLSLLPYNSESVNASELEVLLKILIKEPSFLHSLKEMVLKYLKLESSQLLNKWLLLIYYKLNEYCQSNKLGEDIVDTIDPKNSFDAHVLNTFLKSLIKSHKLIKFMRTAARKHYCLTFYRKVIIKHLKLRLLLFIQK